MRIMHQSTTPSLSQTIWSRWASRQFLNLPIVQTFPPVIFGYFLGSEAVIMRQLRRWKRLWRRSLIHSLKRISMGPSRSCWNGTTSALQPEEITSKGSRISCVYYQETYLMILVSFTNVWKQVYLGSVGQKLNAFCFNALSVMVIIVGNGSDDLSSKPGWGCLHFTLC